MDAKVMTAGGSRGWMLGMAAAILIAVGLAGGLNAASAAPGPTDLELTKIDSADPVISGASFVYTIQVANNGANDATDVVVTDALPSRVSFSSVDTTDGSCAREKATVTCELGTINAGTAATIRITVKAGKDGTASNTASLTTSVADTELANNQDTETTVIAKKPGKAKRPKPSCAAPTISGTPGPDVLVGTRRADAIRAFGGDDRVFALGGKDLVCADRGNDVVSGGEGGDTVIGGGGRDKLVGNEGGDVLKGKAGRDRLAGRSGDDFLAGGKGRDRCKGGAGRDLLLSCP